MLILFAEQMIAGRSIILSVIPETVKQVFLWVPKLILNLTHYYIIDPFFIIRLLQLVTTQLDIRTQVPVRHSSIQRVFTAITALFSIFQVL